MNKTKEMKLSLSVNAEKNIDLRKMNIQNDWCDGPCFHFRAYDDIFGKNHVTFGYAEKECNEFYANYMGCEITGSFRQRLKKYADRRIFGRVPVLSRPKPSSIDIFNHEED